jgi:hypothetical protein
MKKQNPRLKLTRETLLPMLSGRPTAVLGGASLDSCGHSACCNSVVELTCSTVVC